MTANSIIRPMKMALTVSIVLACWVTVVWAAEETGFTRETYDLLMRWLNFIILAGVIIKYARRPIANFLKEKKAEVAGTIEKLEARKKAATEKLLVCQNELTANQARLASIKDRLIAEGENRKAEIIADAQNESRLMLETAKLRIDHQIREMHALLKSELIDTATQMALTKLPGIVNTADHDRLIHQWLDAVQK